MERRWAPINADRRRGGTSVHGLIAFVLLVVITLAGLFFGWLLPAYYQAWAAAKTSASSGRLKVIGLALHNYHDTYGELPPPYIADENGKPMHSWRVLILPFIEEGDLYDQYDFDEPWDGPNNRLLMSQRPDAYSNPRISDKGGKTTTYQVIAGPDALLDPAATSRKFADAADGLDMTALVAENFGKPVIWTEPDDLTPQQFLAGQLMENAPDAKAWVMMGDTSMELIGTDDVQSAKPSLTRDAGD